MSSLDTSRLLLWQTKHQGRRNKFRSGTARTGVWGCDPQRGSKGQSPWWGSRGETPWKPALLKNLNHNLYSKLIWDYYKMGCVILTRKLFNLLKNRLIFFSPLFFCLFFYFFFNAEKWCGFGRTGHSGSDAPAKHINITNSYTLRTIRPCNSQS